MLTDTVSPFIKKDATAHIPKSMKKLIHEMNTVKSSSGVAINGKRRNGTASVGAGILPIKKQQTQTNLRNFGLLKNGKKKTVTFSSPMTNAEEAKTNTTADEATTSSVMESRPKSKFNYKKSNLSNGKMIRSTNGEETLYNMDSDELISLVHPIVEFANEGRNDTAALDVGISTSKNSETKATMNSSQWTTFNDMVQSLPPFDEKELKEYGVSSDFEEVSGVFGSNGGLQNPRKTWKEKLQSDNEKLDDMLQQIASMNSTIMKWRKEISKFGFKK